MISDFLSRNDSFEQDVRERLYSATTAQEPNIISRFLSNQQRVIQRFQHRILALAQDIVLKQSADDFGSLVMNLVCLNLVCSLMRGSYNRCSIISGFVRTRA